MNRVQINTSFITLGQLLKREDIVSSGGEAKILLSENPKSFYINGKVDNRRGRKLFSDDKILIKKIGEFQIVSG